MEEEGETERKGKRNEERGSRRTENGRREFIMRTATSLTWCGNIFVHGMNETPVHFLLLDLLRGTPFWLNFIVHITHSSFLQRAQCSHCKRCISYGNSVRLSVRPSVCPSVCHTPYCVKTTVPSTMQFAPLDSKMCLVL